ncbi:hypothetical protein [Nocardia brevicatena]|nr:hypothetical protein [Nocardia brevicatena]
MDPVTGFSDTVTDAIQLTSIDELQPFLNPRFSPTRKEIIVGRGPW